MVVASETARARGATLNAGSATHQQEQQHHPPPTTPRRQQRQQQYPATTVTTTTTNNNKRRVALDEAQNVANTNSVAAVAASSLWRRYAWVVTGTVRPAAAGRLLRGRPPKLSRLVCETCTPAAASKPVPNSNRRPYTPRNHQHQTTNIIPANAINLNAPIYIYPTNSLCRRASRRSRGCWSFWRCSPTTSPTRSRRCCRRGGEGGVMEGGGGNRVVAWGIRGRAPRTQTRAAIATQNRHRRPKSNRDATIHETQPSLFNTHSTHKCKRRETNRRPT